MVELLHKVDIAKALITEGQYRKNVNLTPLFDPESLLGYPDFVRSDPGVFDNMYCGECYPYSRFVIIDGVAQIGQACLSGRYQDTGKSLRKLKSLIYQIDQVVSHDKFGNERDGVLVALREVAGKYSFSASLRNVDRSLELWWGNTQQQAHKNIEDLLRTMR